MAEQVQIILSSFVRKTINSEMLKSHIRSSGATLSRKGRSRNWLLRADHEQIQNIIKLINASGESSWVWIAKKLTDNKPKLNYAELITLAKKKPTITVTEIISLTDCTLAEALSVLHDIECE